MRLMRRGWMATQRKRYSAEYEVRVTLEALKGQKSINRLASTYRVHPTQGAYWKHRLHKEMPDIVSARRAKHKDEPDYMMDGSLKFEGVLSIVVRSRYERDLDRPQCT